MPKDEVIIEGWSTSGQVGTKPKLLFLRHYEGGWEVHLGIADPKRGRKRAYDQARAAIKLRPEEAERAAKQLLEFASRAREARGG